MQAEVTLCQEEIVRRLEAVGLQATVSVVGPMAKGDAKFWSALLPTDEERLAIKALRAGLIVMESQYPKYGKFCAMRPDLGMPGVWLVVAYGNTPIVALAAAGRVLEEWEQRG